MLVLVGYVLVVGSVFGGYSLAGGHLARDVSSPSSCS